ncbi:hypothetical protein NLG97_g1668 [Lecanicillium saksenae]|uniref:Uncharacterized protein n=1 Tax=Lecanicillium saksenae TaxID=468837 RepID=A0ACC1R5R8_9HYPO|nr:hypothetical protein NLG97_g1668 [Lecanicillium saksenae]
MLFNTILSLLWAATLVAAFPFLSLPKWYSSSRSVEAANVEARATETVSSTAGAPGGFCGWVPVEKPVNPTVDSTASDSQKSGNKPDDESSAASQTLPPSVHWSWDTSLLKNVEPVAAKDDSHMYYGESDPTKEGYFAFLTYRFTLPSVNLDHSDHVNAEYTKDGSLKVIFKTSDSFERATSSWSTDKDLLLIATAKGCTGPSAEDRCYFRATTLAVDREAKTVTATGAPEHPENVMESAETEWGLWAPHNSTFGNSTASAGKSFNYTANGAGQESSKPPHDSHGLTTAPFGQFFDSSLDDAQGYHELHPDAQAFLDQIIADGEAVQPAPSSNGSCNSIGSGQLRRRHILHARGFWKNLWHGVVDGIKSVYNTVADALTIQGDFNEPVSWDLPGASFPIPTETSPWSDNSIALFKHEKASESGEFQEHVNIYCVDCGVSGQAVFSGKAKITPLKGIFDGELAMRTNMKMVLKVGVDAQIKYSQNIQHDLFTFGLPGLTYGIVTVGPYISVAAKVGLEAAAKGKLLVGGEMGLTQASAVLYIFEPGRSTAAGWTPYFKPVLDAEGEIMLAASAALPISIKVGLKVASFETALGIVEEPAISAVAQVAGTASYDNANGFQGGLKDFGGCSGIATSLNWSNKLSLDILGITSKVLQDTGFQPIVKGCLNLDTVTKPKSKAPNMLLGMQNSASDEPHRFANTSLTNTASARLTDKSTNTISSSCSDVGNTSPQVFKNGHQFDLAPLLTTIGTSMLASCNDGNIYVAAAKNETNKKCSSMWPTSKEAIVPFDGGLNVMHYYSDTMNAVGVSRLRSSPAYKIPNDAVITVLVPAPAADGSFFYMAADASQQVFYPIVCDFAGGAVPRVFLAKDMSAGIKMLEGGSVAESITGAKAEKCFGLSLSPRM